MSTDVSGKPADDWLTREKQFTAFVKGPLHDFWQQREEGIFVGVGNVRLCYVRFCHARHTQVVVLVTGRIESYIKYAEVAYDLFTSGFDVMILDHRGQGLSGRLLADRQRGHVDAFDDYVDDLSQFIQLEITPRAYIRRFALAHSMGGAILTQLIIDSPDIFNAVALCAPMFGIHLPAPLALVQWILSWAEKYPRIRNCCVPGKTRWQYVPYAGNPLTHSHARYQYYHDCYTDLPASQLGGPTYHWVHESLQAIKKILARAGNITTPLLLLQASEDSIVDNRSHVIFCKIMAQAGQNRTKNQLIVIKGARHEILFEQDRLRAEALSAITDFFAQHH